MAKKQTLVERFGTLPAGMSKADVEVVLQFLYGAFERHMQAVSSYQPMDGLRYTVVVMSR